MRPTLCFVFLLILSTTSLSQVAADSTATLEGAVSDAKTSQPIRGAVITLTTIAGGGSRQQTTSDSEGRFRFAGLLPGNYRAFIQARGYLPKVYGSTSQASSGSAVSLKAGQHLSGLSFELKQLGVIRGRVVNADGDPMVRCGVQALRVNARRNQPRGMSSGETDDRGEYRIFDLTPGDYYVIANCQGYGGLSMARGPGADPMADGLSYVPTYYPGAAEMKQASVITLRSADEVSVDLTVSKQHTYHVRGSVAGAGEQAEGPMPMAMLVPRDLAIVQGPRGAPVLNGKFDIAGVVPGSYVLVVTTPQPESLKKIAREDVEVGNANVEGLALVLGNMSTMKGTLRVEGGVPPNTNLSMLMVHLQASDAGSLAGPSLIFSNSMAQVKPDGTFEIADVAPGNYAVGLTANGTAFRDWYTKSVRFGSRDVTDTGFRISSGSSGTLDILVSPRGSSIDGTVVDSNHQPVAGVGVMAIPDENRRKRWDLYDSITTDDRGHFELRGLAAGDYSIVAAEDLDMDDRFDVETMGKFAREGASVRLDDAEHKTLELHPAAGVRAQE